MPVRSGGEYKACYGMWTRGHWWDMWMRRETSELRLGEAEDGKVLGAARVPQQSPHRVHTAKRFQVQP